MQSCWNTSSNSIVMADDQRLSTALFTRPTAPHGVVWRHLQETWIVPTIQTKIRQTELGGT